MQHPQPCTLDSHPATLAPSETPAPPPGLGHARKLERSAASLIDRILSGDSRAFLAATRQTGGE